MPTLLLALAALLATLAPVAGAQAPDSLMGRGVSRALAEYRAARIGNVRYALSLDLSRSRDTAYGTARIRFTQRGNGDVILDFRGPKLGRVRINGAPVAAGFNGAHLRIPTARVRRGANVVEVEFAALVAAAGASIIRYRDDTDGEDYLYTLLVPSDANMLFPSFDQPDLKARVSLTLRTPVHWRTLANGALARVDTLPGGRTAVHTFRESDPISTYLIAFAAGPWATRSAVVQGSRVRMFVRASRAREAETDSLIAINTRALAWLETYTARRYPFQKFDFLLAPAFPFGGMEHPGAVFYNEDALIFREAPTQPQLLAREQLVYHEVAHQWFGDLVTMRWFDDLWLKEGFSTYLGAVMQDDLNPRAHAWRTFFLRNKPVAYATDASRGTTPVWQELANLDQAKSNYGPIVYNKAPGILKALNYAVGDTAFRNGLRAYIRDHAFGNATWQDLIAALSRSSGQDLTAFAKAYVLRPGMPVMTQRMGGTSRGWGLILEQRPAQALSGEGSWPLSTEMLTIRQDGRSSRERISFQGHADYMHRNSPGEMPALVFFNAGDHAYVMTMLDSTSARWAEQNVGTIRDPLDRAMLWSALWDLVRDARLEPARFARAALRALPAEQDDYIVPFIVGRTARAVTAYACESDATSLRTDVERVLAAGAADSSRAYSVRKVQLDAFVDLARTPAALARLDAALDSTTLLGLPLRAPTRWAIVTTLLGRGHNGAQARLAAEQRRDSTSDGRRRAFVAGAAPADSATKAAYWARYFNDSALNESWATASLGPFNDVAQADLTLRYLRPALDTLPWIQQNRRIFYLGSWLSSFMSGKRSPEALQVVERFLTGTPSLAPDLRLKVLQASDELERTVRIRQACSASR